MQAEDYLKDSPFTELIVHETDDPDSAGIYYRMRVLKFEDGSAVIEKADRGSVMQNWKVNAAVAVDPTQFHRVAMFMGYRPDEGKPA